MTMKMGMFGRQVCFIQPTSRYGHTENKDAQRTQMWIPSDTLSSLCSYIYPQCSKKCKPLSFVSDLKQMFKIGKFYEINFCDHFEGIYKYMDMKPLKI